MQIPNDINNKERISDVEWSPNRGEITQ